MAYIPVESDDRPDNDLQFQTFAPGTGSGTSTRTDAPSGRANANIGNYFVDAPAKPTGGFWTIEYYQQYFDVDTKTVLTRCYTTLLPTSPNYLSTHLTPSADLYGPFWTLSTLIFALFLSSSLAASITSYLNKPEDATEYNFQLLSIAVTVVYTYGLGLPALLWVALRYMGIGEWSIVEAVAVWGYGQFVWIPVAVLCVIPVYILRLVLTTIGFGISGWFLGSNLYPILSQSEHKWTRGLIVIVALLHAGLALTFQWVFFSYYVVQVGTKDPSPGPPGENDAITSKAIAETTTAVATTSVSLVARALGF